MDIVIAGAGEVGTHLANMLSKQEHNIMLIDSDEEKLELLGNQLDVMSIVGSCTSIGALKDAGVHKCDLFIAVNHQEDQNINSAILAKKLGAKQTIARVNNSEYLEDENKEYLKMIGIDSLIYPERNQTLGECPGTQLNLDKNGRTLRSQTFPSRGHQASRPHNYPARK